MDCCRIGRHINISNGFTSAPFHAKSIGCNILQIFLGSPQLILSKPRTDAELKEIASELKLYGMKMVVHGSYTINLCHRQSSTKYKMSVKSLTQDLLASEIIGSDCLGVIIHMGKNVPEINVDNKTAMDNYISGLVEVIDKTTIGTIILETGASQGNEVGSKLEDLAYIYNAIPSEKKSRIKFCIDTAHIWATGYDISDKVSVDKFFTLFDKLIGIDKIACIHFNDSQVKLNSHIDRHADIGYGQIGDSGLKYVATISKKYNIPIIAETPLDAVNIKTNRNITSADELSKIKNWLGIKN